MVLLGANRMTILMRRSYFFRLTKPTLAVSPVRMTTPFRRAATAAQCYTPTGPAMVAVRDC